MPILPATSAVQESDRRERVALVRTPSALCLGVGIVATVIGGFVAGGKGVLAGALGTLVVIAFFAGGQIVFDPKAEEFDNFSYTALDNGGFLVLVLVLDLLVWVPCKLSVEILLLQEISLLRCLQLSLFVRYQVFLLLLRFFLSKNNF